MLESALPANPAISPRGPRERADARDHLDVVPDNSSNKPAVWFVPTPQAYGEWRVGMRCEASFSAPATAQGSFPSV
jgi:hypothetical protein